MEFDLKHCQKRQGSQGTPQIRKKVKCTFTFKKKLKGGKRLGGHLFKIISHQGQIKICPVCDDNIKTYVHYIYTVLICKKERHTH